MVDTNILKGNNELRSLCKQIRREHKEAIELLLAYTDNVEQVFKYCIDWIKKNINGIHIVSEKKRSFEFYTDNMERVFSNNNEKIHIDDKRVKCCCGFGYSDTVACGISLRKDEAQQLSNTQLKIKANFEPNKIVDGSYLSIKNSSVILISSKDRELEFESIKQQVDDRLKNFADNLNKFEDDLLNL